MSRKFSLNRQAAEREKRKLSVSDLSQNVQQTISSPKKKIKIGHQSYEIPTELFAKRSLYFKAMFGGNYLESSSQDEIEVKIQHPEISGIIIDYLMTGAVPEEVNEQNFFPLLTTSKFLQLPQMENILLQVLQDSVEAPQLDDEGVRCCKRKCKCEKDFSALADMPGLGEVDAPTFMNILEFKFPLSEKLLFAAKWMEQSKDLSTFKIAINSEKLWIFMHHYTKVEGQHIYNAFQICARDIPKSFWAKIVSARLDSNQTNVFALWLAAHKDDDGVLSSVSSYVRSETVSPEDASDILGMIQEVWMESGRKALAKSLFSKSMTSFMELEYNTHKACQFLHRLQSRKPTLLVSRLDSIRKWLGL